MDKDQAPVGEGAILLFPTECRRIAAIGRIPIAIIDDVGGIGNSGLPSHRDILLDQTNRPGDQIELVGGHPLPGKLILKMRVVAISTSGRPTPMLVPQHRAAMGLLGRNPRLTPIVAALANPGNRRRMGLLIVKRAGTVLPPQRVGMATATADAVGFVMGSIDNRRRGATCHPTEDQKAPPQNDSSLHFRPHRLKFGNFSNCVRVHRRVELQ